MRIPGKHDYSIFMFLFAFLCILPLAESFSTAPPIRYSLLPTTRQSPVKLSERPHHHNGQDYPVSSTRHHHGRLQQRPPSHRTALSKIRYLPIIAAGAILTKTIRSVHASSPLPLPALPSVPRPITLLDPQATISMILFSLVAAPNLFSSLLVSQTQQLTAWYMSLLRMNPVVTKSISTTIIGLLGDFAAQRYESRQRRQAKQNDPAPSTSTLPLSDGNDSQRKSSLFTDYDVRRGMGTAADSLLISGPLLHYGYSLFESIIPASTSLMAAVCHVLADALVLDSIFVATTFMVSGLFEGIRLPALLKQLRRSYVSTLRCSWGASVALLPIEYVCFRYLPFSLRVLAVNITDLIWDGVVSFVVHRDRQVRH